MPCSSKICPGWSMWPNHLLASFLSKDTKSPKSSDNKRSAPNADETTFDMSLEEGSINIEYASYPESDNISSDGPSDFLLFLLPAKGSRSMIGLISSVLKPMSNGLAVSCLISFECGSYQTSMDLKV